MSYNDPSCPIACALPIYSKANSSFSGNTNMPGSINTAAFRYAQLVSLPFRSRGSGKVMIISNTNQSLKNVQPPRNTF